ncbi:MAG: ABC transporter permease [Actinomycetota bacterium]
MATVAELARAPLALRVVEMAARTYKRTWRGSIITAFISPLLFLGAMGYGLGTLVDSGSSVDLGVPYVAFIAPALLAASTAQTGANEGSWPVMAGIKWVKTYHAALATPVGISDLALGIMLWLGIRLFLTSIVFVIVAGLLGALDVFPALAAIPVAILTGMAFAAPIAAYTAMIDDETRLVSIYRFIIVPMFLFSGTFFPIEELPDWLETVALFTPLWHGVDLCRWIVLGIPTRLPAFVELGYLLLWAGAGVAASLVTFRRRLLV